MFVLILLIIIILIIKTSRAPHLVWARMVPGISRNIAVHVSATI